jgi:hypothetical protein
MGESEVGVNQKYVPYTYKKILTVVHTNAPQDTKLATMSADNLELTKAGRMT